MGVIPNDSPDYSLISLDVVPVDVVAIEMDDSEGGTDMKGMIRLESWVANV